MMGLYFLVLVAVGILRPIKNALALDGLAEGDFYQVYLVSAVVILFAPAFNQLADRIRWRTLIPGTAAFFATNLIVFRMVYSEGSTVLGMVFYGWYDLFAAALVTQFFMAVQIFFNARDAKSAVPLVIAAGSTGAVLGGLMTGLLAQTLGTPNLLLLAGLFVGIFAAALPFIWRGYPPVRGPGHRVRKGSGISHAGREFVEVFSNRHIRLIAGLVLVTVVVKTVVDYEFNEASAVFAGDLDSISSFQGYVLGVKDALPILVLLPLGPMLRRWGVGLAVMMLPVAMLGLSATLAVAFSIWTATVAKAGDSMFRYSAERTAREVLYVPVPTELKLKAKAWVDMALEKGLGKALSGALIFVLLGFMNYRGVTWMAVGLSIVWCLMALAAKQQYVRALAESIQGRFANLEGGFASLTERSTLAMVEEALRGDAVQVGFGLDLVEQAGSVDAKHLADEMELLLGHEEEEVRARVLRLLARFPGLVPPRHLSERLADESEQVREAAVGALLAGPEEEASIESLLAELLRSTERPVRVAVLSWLGANRAGTELARRIGEAHLATLSDATNRNGGSWGETQVGDPATRVEIALAAGVLGPGSRSSELLTRLSEDPDHTVARCALRSAGWVGSPDLRRRLVSKLADPSLRSVARQALIRGGTESAAVCGERLTASEEVDAIRRHLPSILARIQDSDSIARLLATVADPGTAREVRYQALKALNKLRADGREELPFDREVVTDVAVAEAEEAQKFAKALAALKQGGDIRSADRRVRFLSTVVEEALAARREATFRLLGLVFPPEGVYRSHSALTRSDDRARANALEWMERTLGHGLFQRLLPALSPDLDDGASAQDPDLRELLADLGSVPEPWLASVVEWSEASESESPDTEGRARMELIEKVFLLQKVDLLQGARSSHLGLLASIAEEIEIEAGEVLMEAGQPNDSLYIIVRGAVELSGVADQKLMARENTPFGTWSLIDSDPSVVGARATEPTRVLRITRSDFQDLLTDHPELATGILQALARRVRSLVA